MVGGRGSFAWDFRLDLREKGVGVGRAVLKSVNGEIPAGWDRFKPDEPGHGANRA